MQPLLAEFSELLRMERENEADQIETGALCGFVRVRVLVRVRVRVLCTKCTRTFDIFIQSICSHVKDARTHTHTHTHALPALTQKHSIYIFARKRRTHAQTHTHTHTHTNGGYAARKTTFFFTIYSVTY